MFTVRKHRLQEGLNHISMPRYAEPLCIGALPSGLHLWYRAPGWAVTLQNRIFVVVSDDQPFDAQSYDVRHIGSVVHAYIHAHVFELVTIERHVEDDQLVEEGR